MNDGSKKARITAANKLTQVKKAMKINYFEDIDLINEQSKKYNSDIIEADMKDIKKDKIIVDN